MTASDNSERWLARHVIYGNNEYGLSLIELYQEDGKWVVNISPYTCETHSTAYHSGSIRITTHKDPSKKPRLEFF